MARSSISSLLALDRYAAIMGINRYHFNNLDDGNYPDNCLPYWGQAGHDTLALELANAEEMIRQGLGFDIAPQWRTEIIPFEAPRRRGSPWQLTTPRTPYGQVQAFGTRAATVLEAGATVNYSGDTGTISVTGVGGIDPSEIRIYYQTADGASSAGDEGWRIRPLTITSSGGTATISGHKAQFVQPSVLAAATPAEYDTAGNYVTAVDVYRVYTNPQLPLLFLWDPLFAGTADPENHQAQQGVARLLNAELGRFEPRPATWDSNNSRHVLAVPSYGVPPDSIQVSYLAGVALRANGLIEQQLEECTVRLANTLMPCPPNHLCDAAEVKWQRDRDVPEPLTVEVAMNPYGQSTGALFALRVIRTRRLITAGTF